MANGRVALDAYDFDASSPEQKLSALLRDAGARGVAVLSGAGISSEHPSRGPVGNRMMTDAMAAFFASGTLGHLKQHYSKLPVWLADEDALKNRPRLEVVLDIASQIHGESILGGFSDAVDSRSPNRVHRMLAEHLRAGGRQLTANFDTWIERVLGLDSHPSLHHFHGRFGLDSAGVPFGAVLSKIQHGFGHAERAQFLSPLLDSQTKAVVFVGYSFSDYFDATPALVGAAEEGLLARKTLVWINHGRQPRKVAEVTEDSAVAPSAVKKLVASGLEVYEVACNGGDALRWLLSAAGLQIRDDPATDQCDDCPHASDFAPVGDLEARKRATIELIARMGMLGTIGSGAEVSRLGVSFDDLSDVQQAEFWWKKGRYSRGRRAALRDARAGQDYDVRGPIVRSRFHWIQGRNVRAALAFVRAKKALDRRESAPASLRAEVNERFGRNAVAAVRSPDTARLLLPWLLGTYQDYVEDAKELAESREITAVARIQVRDALNVFEYEVLRRERAFTDTATADSRVASIETLGEYEDLGSFADLFRANGNSRNWPVAPEEGNTWHDDMAKIYDAVGNQADTWRLRLLPGDASTYASIASAFAGAFALDISSYQRLRFLAVYLKNAREAD